MSFQSCIMFLRHFWSNVWVSLLCSIVHQNQTYANVFIKLCFLFLCDSCSQFFWTRPNLHSYLHCCHQGEKGNRGTKDDNPNASGCLHTSYFQWRKAPFLFFLIILYNQLLFSLVNILNFAYLTYQT